MMRSAQNDKKGAQNDDRRRAQKDMPLEPVSKWVAF